MSTKIGAYSRNINNLYGQLSRFIAGLDCDNSDVLNYCDMLLPSSCDLIQTNSLDFTPAMCKNMPDGILNQAPVQVIRWMLT